MFDYNIAEKCKSISPVIGDEIYIKEIDMFIPESKSVIFTNRYGILVQWINEVTSDVLHKFYTYGFCKFILASEYKKLLGVENATKI